MAVGTKSTEPRNLIQTAGGTDCGIGGWGKGSQGSEPKSFVESPLVRPFVWQSVSSRS